MLALLLLASVVAFVWLLNAPGQRFLPSFVQLLENASVAGAWTLLSGRALASGTFAGRPVAIELQLKRGRYSQGYLIVSMRTNESVALDSAGVDARATGDAARRALFTLATRDLQLSVDAGWLRARWQPQGFVLFPGTFNAPVWRDVLDAMQTVAASLDAAAAG